MTTDRLPRYRVLTGPDDAAFCSRVSEALDLGYQLHGSPALTVNDGTTIVAQALLWPGTEPPPPRPLPGTAPPLTGHRPAARSPRRRSTSGLWPGGSRPRPDWPLRHQQHQQQAERPG